MSRYCSLLDLRDYMGLPGTQGQNDDGLLQDSLNRAEAAIDNYTRRNFVGTAGTVYYSRFDQWRVVDTALYLASDLIAPVEIQLGNSQNIPLGSIWLGPRNNPPYRIIRLRSAYVWQWNTDQDMFISGTWGYSTTAPADIQQATVRTAAYLYRIKDQSGFTDVTGFEQAGEQTIVSGIPSDVRYLLNPYRTRTGGMV